jgi:hypothetical protein
MIPSASIISVRVGHCFSNLKLDSISQATTDIISEYSLQYVQLYLIVEHANPAGPSL